jgi:hypothetical protein
MAEKPARLTGTIWNVEVHDKLGSYGTIEAEDGNPYVFEASQFYRDGTHIRAGETVTFFPVERRYATNITSQAHG